MSDDTHGHRWIEDDDTGAPVLMIRPDETRVIVDGLEVPPYEGALAYVRNTLGVYGIRYADRTDWLGTAGQAFGDDQEITVHPDEDDAR